VLIKVVAVQSRLGSPLTLEERIHIFKQRPDVVCLPEYYMVGPEIADYHRAAVSTPDHLKSFQRLSDELSTCLVAGTVVEGEEDRLYNACYVINRGLIIGRYRKRYPVPGELSRGITPGDRQLVLDVEGVRIGIMICGDVFYPELYDEHREAEVDLIVIPTTSAYRPADSKSQKEHRDRKYFQDGAVRSGGYVVKVCGVGTIFGKPLQGRSLVAAPWDMVAQVESSAESRKRILSVTLDIAELRDFRHKMFTQHTGRTSQAAIQPLQVRTY